MKRRTGSALLAALLTLNVYAQSQRLTASDGLEGDKFGWSVDLDEDRLIVGAPARGDFGANSGAAYVFTFEGSQWTQEARLTAGDQLSFNDFGYSVSIDGDYAAVGARTNYTGAGAVYVFRRNGVDWEEEAKIDCPDCASMQNQALFGRAVSLQGNRLLVGGQQSRSSLYEAGIAYMFRREGAAWVLEKTILPSDAAITAQFGWSVALDDPYAVVGAPFDPLSPNNPMGAAYIFRRNENDWDLITKLLPEPIASSQNFGFSVALAGGIAVIGNPSGTAAYGKTATLFELLDGQWVRTGLLSADGRNDNFSRSVGVFGGNVVVGNTRFGAYLYRRNGPEWNFSNRLEPVDPDGAITDFGESVAINAHVVAVGDPSGRNETTVQTGSVLVYTHTQAVDREELSGLPVGRSSLYGNYPNPFTGATRIGWNAPASGRQTLSVFDILGNEVVRLVDEDRPAGAYDVEFDASSLPAGLFVYRLSLGSAVFSGKMLVVR